MLVEWCWNPATLARTYQPSPDFLAIWGKDNTFASRNSDIKRGQPVAGWKLPKVDLLRAMGSSKLLATGGKA
jgi:hypothetical protein